MRNMNEVRKVIQLLTRPLLSTTITSFHYAFIIDTTVNFLDCKGVIGRGLIRLVVWPTGDLPLFPMFVE